MAVARKNLTPWTFFPSFSVRTTHWLIDWCLIWACIENENENGMEMDLYENTWKWMKMSGNKKTELKLLKKCTLIDNWNSYDPFGEVFFFAVGPFLKHSVFLAPAFAFGCGFFWAPTFAFGCGLIREPSSSLGCLTTVSPLARAAPRAGKTQ